MNVNRSSRARNLKNYVGLCAFLLSCLAPLLLARPRDSNAEAQSLFLVDYGFGTGGIQKIVNADDPHKMNWILLSDGSQFPWQTSEQAWGLGFCTVLSGTNATRLQWRDLSNIYRRDGGIVFEYHIPPLKLEIFRTLTAAGTFQETYRFTNISERPARVKDIGIYTPFNDNYPNAETCIPRRCNAHIWAGHAASYVNAIRMGGAPPHLGLVLTQGSLKSYEVRNRGLQYGSSNFRGTIILNVEDFNLQPNRHYDLSWTMFWHEGWEDFFEKAIQQYGFVKGSANSYTLEKGKELTVTFTSARLLDNVRCFLNARPIEFIQEGPIVVIKHRANKTGEHVFKLLFGEGHYTLVRVLVIEDKGELIRRRVDFIVNRQQNRNRNDPRYGAYMVYDNELNQIYFNDGSRMTDEPDGGTNEGAERLGMGVLLAMYLQRDKNQRYMDSAVDYYNFVRNKLQTEDYKVYATVGHKDWNRGYNYPWVARFYLEMYRLTGAKKYLEDFYHTLKCFYHEFGYGFYAVDIPAKDGCDLLTQAGMLSERDSLMADFRKMGETYLKNGVYYPKMEVNYEQGIVAPCVTFLCEMYLLTHEMKYLNGAQEQLQTLEAFSGRQPDYHLNEIAIRHWDGFWLGKYQFWGDVFPHYWSTLTAVAYWRYYQATGKQEYLTRAQSILDNNLCQFFENGSASCAYIYPANVNGKKAQFFDAFANDQDWALVFYLMVNREN